MRYIKVSALFLFSVLLLGCDKEIPPERMKSGEDLYNYYCKDCHMRKGPGAYMEHYAGSKPMKPYKILLLIKYDFKKSQHSMPTFKQLSDKQADALTDYIIELQTANIEGRSN